MTKVHDPQSTRVTCPKGHYLGSVLNLVTARPVYCEVCNAWHDWVDLEIGRRPKPKDVKP
jgi:hypothetical protein